jgi:hypothetical protein
MGGFSSKFEYLINWEGCMGSMQYNGEFGYQLSIYSGTRENWLLVAVLTVQFVPHRKHSPSP